MANKTIVITGATGFVGSSFTNYFANKGYKIYAFGRKKDFTLKSLVQKYDSWDIAKGQFFGEINPDIVIHCAGSVTHWGSFDQMFKVNVLGTQNVLQSFPKAKFIHISTASVYDPFESKDKVSEEIHKPKKYLNFYQETKWQAERKVAENSENYIIFRPHAIYGQHDTTILPRLERARKKSLNRFLLLGDGQNQTSLTYIGNLAMAVELAINSNIKNQIYNVADTKVATLKEILDEFKKVRNYPEKYLKISKKLAWILGFTMEKMYQTLPFRGEPLLTRYVVSQLTSNYILNLNKIQTDLGYKPIDNYLNKFIECYGN